MKLRTSSFFLILLFLRLFLLTTGKAEVLYSINFEEPTDHVGSPPVVGAPHGVGGISFGSPVVVGGNLDGNCLQLVGRQDDDQIVLYPTGATGFIQLEFDVLTENLAPTTDIYQELNFAVNIEKDFTSRPVSTVELNDNARHHVVMKVDFHNQTATNYVDGNMIPQNEYAEFPPNLQSLYIIRIGLGPRFHNFENLSAHAYVDNIVLTTAGPVQLTDLNDNSSIIEGGTAWITGNDPPKMPSLQAIFNTDDPDAAVKWDFAVTYTRPNGDKVTDDQIHYVGTGQTWNIYNLYQPPGGVAAPFFGGDATLTCTVPNQTVPPVHFKILGKSPDPATCKNFIETRPGAPYYAYAMAKVESYTPKVAGQPRYNQFYRDHGKLTGKKAKYEIKGYPVWGDDGSGVGGFGLFQITGVNGSGSGDLPRGQLWNWQENVQGGLQILGDKVVQAQRMIAKQRAKAIQAGGSGVVPQVSFPRDDFNAATGKVITALPVSSPDYCVLTGGDAENGGVPQSATISFQDGTNETIADAQAIKLYNGGGFCGWRDSNWIFKRYRTYSGVKDNGSYVDLVAAQLEESKVKALPVNP